MKDKAFEFGKNWQRYLNEEFSEERLKIALQHLLDVLKLDSLSGNTVIDIGCGSGIHSLAAFQANADAILSIDVDPDSVNATLRLWELAGKPENWQVLHGSVLDEQFMSNVGQFDIVYSWGVLHHTGDMWTAIRNASITLKPSGIMYIALYADEVYHTPSPQYWIDLKRQYNNCNQTEKEDMEYDYAWNKVLKPLADKGENPLLYIKEYKQKRGMEFWTDVRDWLGGYPMDFAKTRDMIDFAHNRLNMEVIDTRCGSGNTEYLLKHRGQPCYFDSYLDSCESYPFPDNIQHVKGFCYAAEFPQFVDIADTDKLHYRSNVQVLEDGSIVGFAHARFKWIEDIGEGQFAHWKEHVFFSSSDNTDPRVNGRTYRLRVPRA